MFFSPVYLDGKYDEILNILEKDDFSNVVLVVGAHGTGKTTILKRLVNEKECNFLNVGKILSAELRLCSVEERSLTIEPVLEKVAKVGDIFILDNTEILFQPELKLNVIRLLSSLSRRRKGKMLISIAGIIKGTDLIFSEPPFYDNRKYDIHEFKTVYIGE